MMIPIKFLSSSTKDFLLFVIFAASSDMAPKLVLIQRQSGSLVSPPSRSQRRSAVGSSSLVDVVGRDIVMEPVGLDPPDMAAPSIVSGPPKESNFGSWLLVSHVTVGVAVPKLCSTDFSSL